MPDETGSVHPPLPMLSPDANVSDQQSAEELLALVYDELRRLARSRLSNEPNRGAGMTLQATALVHEAYLRLMTPPAGEAESATKPAPWQNRGHFFGAAALAMRRILVERARHQSRHKHGGTQTRTTLEGNDVAENPADFDRTDIVALDEAVKKLEQIDPRKGKIVSLRYFAGLSIRETAGAMDLSPATVKTEWAFARAWLHRELTGEKLPDKATESEAAAGGT